MNPPRDDPLNTYLLKLIAAAFKLKVSDLVEVAEASIIVEPALTS